MTLEQLRIFVAVAEREHVTRASRVLNLTQSAVSGAVAALEARHGVQLFDRVGRGVALNEHGRVFMSEARAVLARAAAAEAALNDLGALRRGRLSIFASQTIASYWLPARLLTFHTNYPGVELAVSAGNTGEVARAVREGSAELGFVEGPVEDAALSREVVAADQMIVLVTPGHDWLRRTRLSTADLTAAPWVLREPGSGTRACLESALGARGVTLSALNVTMTLPSNEGVLAAAIAGAGAVALSQSVARDALAGGRLVEAPMTLPERTFTLVRHAERYRSRAGDAFAALARA